MTDIEFQPWPKIPRLNRGIVVTEKIDGTNAAVIIGDDGSLLAAQSRSRIITPEDDNYGFARWCADHTETLAADLGPGRHFGEWWGAGIQRRYGLAEKRLSLFNTGRYGEAEFITPGLGTVPVLYHGRFDQGAIDEALNNLAANGSVAAPGFMDPEGVVVFVSAAQSMFKVTIKGDEAPKSLGGAA